MDLCDEVGMEVEGMGDGECENEQGRDFDPPPPKKPPNIERLGLISTGDTWSPT